MRLYHSCGMVLSVLVVAGAMSACQYAGAGPSYTQDYDFSAAASKDWIVSISNHVAHAQHTANPTFYGSLALTDDGYQQYLDMNRAPLCGTPPVDGMAVIHSDSTARFFYVGLSGSGPTPNIVCVSSAVDSNPFAIDRENDFDVVTEFGVTSPDQPSIVVADDKIAFTIDDHNVGKTTVVVISLEDFLAGANPAAHTPLRLNTIVRLTPVQFSYDLFWTHAGNGANVVIGRIRGVPGRADAVRTRTTTMPLNADADETAGVMSAGIMHVAAITGGGQSVETLTLINLQLDDSYPFAGLIVGQGLAPIGGPLTLNSYLDNWHLSVAASPFQRLAVGWVTDDGVPHYFKSLYDERFAIGVQDTNVVAPAGRRDFVPMGVGFQTGDGNYWTCVGWGDGTALWQFAGGQHLHCWRDDMFP
jgi:hypothetical protein